MSMQICNKRFDESTSVSRIIEFHLANVWDILEFKKMGLYQAEYFSLYK